MLPWTKSSPVLLIDVSNLCWRSYYALKGAALSAGDIQTGVLYGVFRDIVNLADRFQSNQFVWCFDSNPTRRKEVFPEYKANRVPSSPEERKKKQVVKKQIDHLFLLLNSLGFRNIFRFEGYEADDLIARIAKDIRVATEVPEDRHFIVAISSDHDLYQILRTGVRIHDPRTQVDWSSKKFESKYGIPPRKWAEVKAIAGCGGDNVPGILKVAESTAIKYLLGELKPHFKTYQNIVAGRKIIKRNRRLVTLPFEGCPTAEFSSDELSRAKWNGVMSSLNMDSLKRKYPF